MKKRIVLIGGAGEVGHILNQGLKDDYELVTIDLRPKPKDWHGQYIQADATNFDALKAAIPADTDVLVDLLKIAHQSPEPIDPPSETRKLSDVYVAASLNILHAANALKIKRVVYASTNHVTGAYESGGVSSLHREITTQDMPCPDSLYGAMKLAIEAMGKLFSDKHGLSVIGLRIGTVSLKQDSLLPTNQRWHKTLLSQVDTVGVFKAAFETQTKHGIYYAVSDNANKPWSIDSTIKELGFKPQENTTQILARLATKNYTPGLAAIKSNPAANAAANTDADADGFPKSKGRFWGGKMNVY